MTLFIKLYTLLAVTERRSVFRLLLLMLIGMFFEAASVSLVMPTLALMTQANLSETYPLLHIFLLKIGNPTQNQVIFIGMLCLVSFYILKSVFLIYMSWQLSLFTFHLQSSLSYRLFKGYLTQAWTFHLQRNSAQLTQNVINEISLFMNGAVQPSMILLTEGLVGFGIVSVLFIIEPIASIIVVSLLGCAACLFYQCTRSRLKVWGERRHHHDELKMKHLQQGLRCVKEMRLLGRENYFLSVFDAHNQGSSQVNTKYKVLSEMPRLWLEFLAIVGLALLVFLLLMQGKSTAVLVPSMGLFAAVAFRLLPSLNRLIGAFQNVRYADALVDRLYHEFKETEQTISSVGNEVFSCEHCIELTHIYYSYPGSGKQILNDINLMIPIGSSMGLIGVSGVGKSTLIDIILGLLTPDQGLLTIDGVDIQKNLRGWQNYIGYVPQVINLIDDTLKRNIAFGIPDTLIDDKAVARALEAAQLLDFVNQKPLGLDTIIGENGMRLSGGQRQRIGIARALYYSPHILVLDEATSALDVTTENEVMKAVNELRGRVTLIIVSHRHSSVEYCDDVYEMTSGCLLRVNQMRNKGNKDDEKCDLTFQYH